MPKPNRPWWIAGLLAAASSVSGLGSVVINELMYHPPDDRDDLQYIELFNAGDEEADLSGWRFEKGVRAEIPSGVVLAPGDYLVLARNPEVLARAHPGLDRALWRFEGRLSHGGEKVVLLDAAGTAVDEVNYDDRAPWPVSPDGQSPSLERICATAGSGPENWAPSRMPELKGLAGTPGRVNDSAQEHLPPVVEDVAASPQWPEAGAPVRVVAQVADAEDLTDVDLVYWTAGPEGESQKKMKPMRRSGAEGASARYEATVSAAPQGQLLRFRILAVNGAGARRAHPHVDEARPALAVATRPDVESASVPIGRMIRVSPSRGSRKYSRGGRDRSRGDDAFIYKGPSDPGPTLYDYVGIVDRPAGVKARFRKDQTLGGLRTVNIIFESQPRHVIAEHLSYELFRRAGVPTPESGFIRIHSNGRPAGYHLLVEQPNAAFLRRTEQDDGGSLYKLLWYGRSLESKFEKKLRLEEGHEDLVEALNGLRVRDLTQRWAFIQNKIDVDEFAAYFAVNMCISNWDGFFNNYFVYHDIEDSGKWRIFPWDEDKTWGDFDGAPRDYSWHTMPLTFGMDGAQRQGGSFLDRFRGRNSWGRNSWWRPPGEFSGPLLATPPFRARFLSLLDDLLKTTFTPEVFDPVFDAVESSLGGEVLYRARIRQRDPNRALSAFQDHMASFRRQLRLRRAFLIEEIRKERSSQR